MLRTGNVIHHVPLLGDVVDALKHAVLSNPNRDVPDNDKVLVLQSAYSKMGFGMGKYSGGDQVLVLAKSGTCPLSTILQNVIDAWRRVAGMHLPNIGEPK